MVTLSSAQDSTQHSTDTPHNTRPPKTTHFRAKKAHLNAHCDEEEWAELP